MSFLFRKFVDGLVLLGLIILFPLEKLLAFLKFVLKKRPNKKSKKTLVLKKSKNKKPKPKSKSKIEIEPIKSKRKLDFLAPFLFGIIFAFFGIFMPFQIYQWYRALPRPILLSQSQKQSTKILDRKGRLLYEIYIDRKYDPIKLKDVPQHVIDSTLAIEDSEFYTHNGVRFLSMLRAAKASLIDDELQGGSTITQQLVKNVLLSPERTFTRKIKEVVLAILVEHKYTKDQILEMYLNNISYGGTAWGIQSASQKYFNKNARDLTLAESSFLAGLPSAPTFYSPFNGGLVESKFRQKLVLNRMVKLGFISLEQAKASLDQKLTFAPQEDYIRAPHFVNYIQKELNSIYGKRQVNFGGFTVKTTLDLDFQEKVQEIVTKGIQDSANLNISNGAAIVLDVKSGEVLAYVGSADYFDQNAGKYDVITAFRQPGSSIKPVTYALALSKGYTAASIIDDSPLMIKYGNDQVYTPVNYDGKFHGKVTLRQALANSYNIPAVKLINTVGVENMVELANQMGLKNWKFDNTYGLAVTLGGKEVRLIDLANVYATLSRMGKYKKLSTITSVTDINGYELFDTTQNEETQVLDKSIAYIITDILSDNISRTPSFGSRSSLYFPGRTVAVKTGTTDQKRDNWTLGYTPQYVVGVWVGNSDNSPMHPNLASGLSGAAPIFNKIMQKALGNSENENFEIPEEIFVKIDQACGNRSEIFVKGTAPKNLCSIRKEKKDN